jgi:hypothetical protein
VTGPKTLVNSVRGQKGQIVLPVTLKDTDWKAQEIGTFSVAEIQRTQQILDDPGLELTMTPPRVQIEIERITFRSVQPTIGLVELRGNERLRSRLLLDSAEFTPDSVQIHGPVKELAADTFPNATEKLFLADIGSQRPGDVQRRLEVALGLTQYYRDRRLTIRGRSCVLSMQVQPEMKQYGLEVPILVDDKALPVEIQGQYQPADPSRNISVNLGGSLLSTMAGMGEPERARWARTFLRLLVKVQPREDGPYPNEITEGARLVHDDPQNPVPTSEYELAEAVSVTLRRNP